ncbi:hypothetical protein J8J14_17655 [Roseomonas sp. SSH11]|uniref:Uncharacterized protein n=1 Tax=Pararoseomonas baculiformis TaxID=2820812 RepID=A0ABS4AK69_9PROT|nr:hypothetical protein [Pararoseomonas baculiformis]MBP0446604.1 hypothetical protein [Pararoseomonas baculiformis]
MKSEAPARRPAPHPATRTDLDQVFGHMAPDRLTVLLLSYLLLPGLLFLAGWTAPWVALPTALAGLAALVLAPGWRGAWPLTARMTLLCLALGLLWAGATGAHHLVYATADWQVRDAVLRDLGAGPWPVGYLDPDGTQWLLRAPLGFYLPAGLVGRFAGFHASQAALWLWTGLGFGILLMMLALLARRLAPDRRHRAFAVLVLVFVLFHGLDLLPNIWLDWDFGMGPLASWGRGGEWWARLFQYSGHVTGILWAPNHAMPAWLLAVLLLRHGARAEFPGQLALPLAAGAFWSPVASAGAALLIVPLLLARHGPGLIRRGITPANLLAAVFAVPVCLYLVAGSAEVPHGLLWVVHPHWSTPLLWALFLLLEVLCWAIPAWLLVQGRILTVSVILLCLVPAYVFGPGNEMTARGGMTPLAVLAVAVAAALLRPATSRAQQAARRVMLAFAVVALGGAVMEASLLLKRPWPASAECSLTEAARHSVFARTTDWAHYLAHWPEASLSGWMREPPLRPSEREAGGAPCWPEGRGP